MARPLRIEFDGALYHVTSRGNARKVIFSDDDDRKIFLGTLARVNEKYNFLCHAYCLMNNHYHLLIETPDGNLSKGMRQLNGVYTQLYNIRNKKTGHVFQGRYKAILIQKEKHFIEVCRYIVLNPVRAKAVKLPEDWEWSSYKATAGLGRKHECLMVESVLEQFGEKIINAEREYREFVASETGNEKLWENVKSQSILGNVDFIERLTGYMEKNKDITEIPRNQRCFGRPGLNELFKEKHEKKERDIRIKEAVYEYGYSQKEVAGYLGMHYSTISRLLNKQE